MDLKLKPCLQQLLVFRACTCSNQKNKSNTEVWQSEVLEKGWCFKFTEGFGKETNPEILSVYPNPKQKPNIIVVVSKQLQSIIFMLFFKNPIFLRKFPLIKLQIYWQTGQAKINNSSKYHSMAAVFHTFYFLSPSNPRCKSAVNVVGTRPF